MIRADISDDQAAVGQVSETNAHVQTIGYQIFDAFAQVYRAFHCRMQPGKIEQGRAEILSAKIGGGRNADITAEHPFFLRK